MYKFTVFYTTEAGHDLHLGDYLTYEEAENTVKGWISECEDKYAQNSQNYSIIPYTDQ